LGGWLQIHINDNFAKFSEALFIADRHAREEVRERSLMQQKLAQKEKAAKEENLRLLAQRAREERSGIAPSQSAVGGATGNAKAAPVAKGMGLGGYGSGSEESGSEEDEESDEEDTEEARERETIRKEKRQEREREMRLNQMGSEQRAKMLMR
jgi:SNW domain-containing protein 1